MKKTHEVIEQTKYEVIDDIICNKCARSCRGICPGGFDGLIERHISCGYGSKFGDGVEFEFSLCEDCLEELFKLFKIDPEYINWHEQWGDRCEEKSE